jgi:hypothetical protein
MGKYIDKAKIVAEIENLFKKAEKSSGEYKNGAIHTLITLSDKLDALEVKDVDLMIHTIITECCDWLVMNTNLSHDEIEGCRNLMLTVKEEQCKTG